MFDSKAKLDFNKRREGILEEVDLSSFDLDGDFFSDFVKDR